MKRLALLALVACHPHRSAPPVASRTLAEQIQLLRGSCDAACGERGLAAMAGGQASIQVGELVFEPIAVVIGACLTVGGSACVEGAGPLEARLDASAEGGYPIELVTEVRVARGWPSATPAPSTPAPRR